MDTLDLDTPSIGYSVDFETDIVDGLASPVNHYARLNVNEPVKVAVQWDLDSDKYEYFRDVYRTIENNGGVPFEINLIVDGASPEPYAAKFVPGTVQTQVADFGFSVTAKLIAIRIHGISPSVDYPVL